MKDIKFSLFDIFAYTFPGLVTLFAFSLVIDSSINRLVDIAPVLQNINIGASLALVITGYIVGFALDSLGTWLYLFVAFKIWGKLYSPKDEIPLPDFHKQRALIKHYSPENMAYIQLWKVLKTMSHNLSFASLLLMVSAIMKAFQVSSGNKFDWGFLAIIAFIFAILFLHRAHIFDSWHFRDLSTVVNALHLEEKDK